ncbi:chemotaxis protein CheE [Phenylobacterium montanum]|uniref:Chemotaxis protein CheE n=1 Tax=Phenylobacterium montanum TaxID=2823693 RepID=A0A975IUJ3_9CAUL|nr:chemotaxis protein CheE [Caulobacter sp. S6]QUD88007.1 chemotaxis protein CheE [Caulobacter sp. S6]
MSEPRFFKVPNRLRKKIAEAGGARVMEHLAAADQNLEDLREPSLAMIDGIIAEMIQTYGKANRRGDEDFADLYSLAARIIDVSAPVAELEIDRAAFHMCELVDRCMGLDRWDWPSVDVHLDALVLLRNDEGALPAAARAQIFLGLKKVHDKLPKPPPPAAEDAVDGEAAQLEA